MTSIRNQTQYLWDNLLDKVGDDPFNLYVFGMFVYFRFLLLFHTFINLNLFSVHCSNCVEDIQVNVGTVTKTTIWSNTNKINP